MLSRAVHLFRIECTYPSVYIPTVGIYVSKCTHVYHGFDNTYFVGWLVIMFFGEKCELVIRLSFRVFIFNYYILCEFSAYIEV